MSVSYRTRTTFHVIARKELGEDADLWEGEVTPSWSLTGAGWVARHKDLRAQSAYCVTPRSAVGDMLKRNGYAVVKIIQRQ